MQVSEEAPGANLADPPWRLASQCAAAAAREPVLALRPCRLSDDEAQRAGLPSENGALLLWRLSIQSRPDSPPLAQLPPKSERELRLRFTRSSAKRCRVGLGFWRVFRVKLDVEST